MLVPLFTGTTPGEVASVPQLWFIVSHNWPDSTVSKSRSQSGMKSQFQRHSVAYISAVGYETDRSGACNWKALGLLLPFFQGFIFGLACGWILEIWISVQLGAPPPRYSRSRCLPAVDDLSYFSSFSQLQRWRASWQPGTQFSSFCPGSKDVSSVASSALLFGGFSLASQSFWWYLCSHQTNPGGLEGNKLVLMVETTYQDYQSL